MAKIEMKIPDWLDRICAWPVMAYRWFKYGYSYRRIYLGEGEWTILDQADYYRIGKYKWIVNGNGDKYYAVRLAKTGTGKIKMVYMQREIMNPPPGILVDHRNTNSLDNRRENLRPATRSQNMYNKQKKKNATSQYIGVHLIKGRKKYKWDARIRHEGILTLLGRYENEIDAARAYDIAAKKYHGEFARVNFPEESNVILR